MPAGPMRFLAGAAAALAYALGSHLLMTHAQDAPATIAFVLGPLAMVGLASLWRARQRVLALAAFVGALVLAQRVAGGGVPGRWLYLAQHAGVHLALAAWFGGTLRAGAEPLVSALARRVHGGLTPALAAYTRNVTRAWTLYFVAMAAASVALFLAGDFAAWSLLANLLTPVLTAAMFVAEYLVRYRLHPEFERVGLAQAVRAYRAYGASGAIEP